MKKLVLMMALILGINAMAHDCCDVKNNEKCVVTGNPIRNRFEVLDRESSLEFFGLDKNTKNIFSFGGSNGSEELNKAVIGILDKFNNNEKISLIHVTGKKNYDKFIEEVNKREIKLVRM